MTEDRKQERRDMSRAWQVLANQTPPRRKDVIRWWHFAAAWSVDAAAVVGVLYIFFA